MTYQVLAVDDDPAFLSALKAMIEGKTNIQVATATKFLEAEKLVADHPIRVAILDQRMPSMTGTEMFPRLQALNPALQGIMLSGFAVAGEVGEALRLGFVDYIDKEDLDSLIPAIHRGMAQFKQAGRINLSEKVYLGCKGPAWIPFWPKTKLYLLAFESVGAPFVPEDCWSFDQEINVGQRFEVEQSETIETSIKLSETLQEEANAGFSIALALKGSIDIGSKISQTVKNETSTEKIQRAVVTKRNKTTLELPAEPSTNETAYLKSRAYYVGTEYQKIRLLIEANHVPNNIVLEDWVTILVPTGFFWNKHVDMRSDASQSEFITARW